MAKGLPDSKKYIKEKRVPLRFGADGKFRILHLTDIHEVDRRWTMRRTDRYR